MNTTPCYIFDIDGTLADCSHRVKHIQGKDKNWDKFFNKMEKDNPILPVINLLSTISYHTKNAVILITGRPEKYRDTTLWWLAKNVAHLDITGHYEEFKLLMRQDGDYRSDAIIKKEIYDKQIKGTYDVKGVFEDRKQVVDMWRSLGLTCFQVAEGDF